ncbi:MAG: hypothetical protein DWH91_19300 [Planctomycetota bacterium]|nr:MAG: hypothetical protein DWH91_19300 [Planctomycetota bacterium]
MQAVRILTAGFTCVMVLATLPLWTADGEYPSIPWFEGLHSVPLSIDLGLMFGLVCFSLLDGALEWLCPAPDASITHHTHPPLAPWAPWRTWAAWSSLACLAMSLSLDQHRLQTWVWQFLWLGIVANLTSREVARHCWRILFIGIYAWSAWSKFDAGFTQTQGPWLWQGLLTAIGFPPSAWGPSPPPAIMLIFPGWEMLAAGLLSFRRTRRWGIAAGMLMHLGLLLTLGPWGRQQQWGVLLWNTYFLLTVPLLFGSDDSRGNEALAPKTWRDRLGLTIAIALTVWPATESLGLCDHWTAWAVYSSRTENLQIEVREADIEQLPASLRPHVGSGQAFADWRPVSLDAWSLTERHCPIYPQSRYRLALAREIEQAAGITLRLKESSPANRWTGLRTQRAVESQEKEAARYWLSTAARIRSAVPAARAGEIWIARTAQLAVACYAVCVLLMIRRQRGEPPTLRIATLWSVGCAFLAIHILCAFHVFHQWNHAAALQHTATRTEEVTGWAWSGGLYINYLFLAFWIWDAVRLWREALSHHPVSSHFGRRIVHGVFAFMMFNATVVFGPWHWTMALVLWGIAVNTVRQAPRTPH